MPKYSKVEKDGVEYYRARFTLGGKAHDVTAITQEQLEEKIYKIKRDFEAGKIVGGENILVSTWADKWLKTYKKHEVVEASYKLYCANVKIYILPRIGQCKIGEVKKYQLMDILNDIADREDKNSKSHINHVKCAITSMFKSAYENGIINSNPAVGLKIPVSAEEGTNRPITETEKKYLFEVCETHYMGLWALMMYNCGLRPIECCGLEWRDINLNDKTIHIRREITKSKAGVRTIPIPDEFVSHLAVEKEKAASNTLPYVLISQQRKKCTTRYLENCWKNIRRHMELKMGTKVYNNSLVDPQLPADFKPYCLRHTYCTNLQRAGVPLNVAKYLMGHSDIRMTSAIYTHQTDDQTESARNLINALQKRDK